MKTRLTFFLLILCASCGDIDFSFRHAGSEEIAIYIVKEGQLKIHDGNSDFVLDKIELEPTPWVKNSDIELYDWSTHTFYLNKPVEREKYSGRHFVVVSGKERLFAGVFFPMYLSSMPQLPMIYPDNGYFFPQDVIQLGQWRTQSAEEILNNEEFKKALLTDGLLCNGISAELLEVTRKNQSDLQYTFQITNTDTKTLYVPDPGKMETSSFFYLTNGVFFFSNNNYCYSNLSEHTSFDSFSDTWYFKLRPGQSMVRTITQKGYSCLQTGSFTFRFTFPGANIKTGEWKKADGRVWTGNFSMEKNFSIK